MVRVGGLAGRPVLPEVRLAANARSVAAKMPNWCSDCRSYFTVKTGTTMQTSKIALRKWAITIYLCLISLKSVSSMKLQRDIDVSQPTA